MDASVVLKVLWREADSDAAERLLDAVGRITAPTLMLYEVANAIRCTPNLEGAHARRAAMEVFAEMPMDLHPPAPGDLLEALAVGLRREVTVYDASYLVLARRLEGRLVTADARFAARVRDPAVTMLADIGS